MWPKLRVNRITYSGQLNGSNDFNERFAEIKKDE